MACCVPAGFQMALVLKNEIRNISSYVIVDCRYPYEYEGGHVKVCFQCLSVTVCTVVHNCSNIQC